MKKTILNTMMAVAVFAVAGCGATAEFNGTPYDKRTAGEGPVASYDTRRATVVTEPARTESRADRVYSDTLRK